MELSTGLDIFGKQNSNPSEALRRVQQRISAMAASSVWSQDTLPAANYGAYSSSSVGGGDFDSLIAEAAARVGLDPDLVRAVVQVESGGRSDAVSPAGAKGLMQLMDGTASGLGVCNSFDPAENLRGGTAFLRYLLDKYGDERLALAAYNAGPGAVEKYGGVPPYAETQRYVAAVLAEKQRLHAWRA
ncbi:MAG: lytic transglycosylase domain-containing protein [Chloroflexota bacterium]